MGQSNIEVHICNKTLGGNGTELSMRPIPGTDRCTIDLKLTRTRADDDDKDTIAHYYVEVDIAELQNAVDLIRDARYESDDDQIPCEGCGRP